jgi:hypothetical protein
LTIYKVSSYRNTCCIRGDSEEITREAGALDAAVVSPKINPSKYYLVGQI